MSGKITGCEALIRWRHPEWGTVSPGEFLPVSESIGLGRAIGRYVFNEAMATAKSWNEKDIDFGRMAIKSIASAP